MQEGLARQNDVPGRFVICRLHVIAAGHAAAPALAVQNWRQVGVVSPWRAVQAIPSAQSSPVCIWPEDDWVQVAPAALAPLLPQPSAKLVGV